MAFSEALISKEIVFRTLQDVVVIMSDGHPVISRTSQFAEAQIVLDGKRYLLCLPLKGVVDSSLERICSDLGCLCNTALSEYRLLRREITLEDSMGRQTSYDVILHALPEGERLDKAVAFVATKRIRAAIELLKKEMLSIGLLHGNLKPSNLIYADDGQLYPIRYNYARLGASEGEIEKEISHIEEFIDGVPEVAEIGEFTSPTEYDKLLPYDEVFPMQDTMFRVRKGDLYGYLNSKREEVIAPQFTYAENFFENRAVVQTADGKMGVINHEQQWIIEPLYDMLGFEDGEFDARIGKGWIKIDYMGKIIK